ncbi:MAG: hypothetical protein ACRDOB_13810 [Streptosporangiaceae bacterium]
MNRLALTGLVIIFVAGAWVVAAPFAMRYQPAGAPWTAAARMDVAVGAVLAAAGLAGFLAGLAGRVRELYAEAGQRAGSGGS